MFHTQLTRDLSQQAKTAGPTQQAKPALPRAVRAERVATRAA